MPLAISTTLATFDTEFFISSPFLPIAKHIPIIIATSPNIAPRIPAIIPKTFPAVSNFSSEAFDSATFTTASAIPLMPSTMMFIAAAPASMPTAAAGPPIPPATPNRPATVPITPVSKAITAPAVNMSLSFPAFARIITCSTTPFIA